MTVFRQLASSLVTLAALSLAAGFPVAADAVPTVVFSHLGDTVPNVSEGWGRLGFLSPGGLDQGLAAVEIGPLSPDPNCGGCGEFSWGIDDRSTVGGTTLTYLRTPTPSQVSDAFAMGWTLRVRVRVASEGDSQPGLADPADSLFAEFGEGLLGGQRRYFVWFGADPNGDPIVELGGDGRQFTSLGSGHQAYVRYDLIFRPDLGVPGVGEATLFVDGVSQLSS